MTIKEDEGSHNQGNEIWIVSIFRKLFCCAETPASRAFTLQSALVLVVVLERLLTRLPRYCIVDDPSG